MTTHPATTATTTVFACEGEHLLGVINHPPEAVGAKAATIGAVIVVGGPQYRAGSHRQFVQWARALAVAGTPTLRFDARGMGDSTGEMRAFTDLGADIGAAIEALRAACPAVERVVLCGLCDGASAALLYLHERRDPRVCGLLLLNPWVRSEQSQARTFVKHYYLQRLLDRGFWAKLLRGQVALGAVQDLVRHLRRAGRAKPTPAASAALSYQAKMALALEALHGPVLLLLSGDDYTAKEFQEHCAADAAWSAILRRPGLQRVELPGADHTLSATADRLALESISARWLAQLNGAGMSPPATITA